MYATFKKEIGRTRTKFRAGEEISLFGCNEGWIPWDGFPGWSRK
jgi:hypothetical protein